MNEEKKKVLPCIALCEGDIHPRVLTCGEEFPWSLDGEYVPGAAQIEIETLPQALELVL